MVCGYLLHLKPQGAAGPDSASTGLLGVLLFPRAQGSGGWGILSETGIRPLISHWVYLQSEV